MKGNLLSAGLALILGAGVMFFITRGRDASHENDQVIDQYERTMKEAQKDIDSLTDFIIRIRKGRKQDSARTAVRVLAKDEVIKKLLNQAKDVKNKNYSDPELDSAITILLQPN